MGDTQAALDHCDRSITLARSVDDMTGVVWSLFAQGWTHYASGDVERGNELMRATLAANSSVGNATATVQSLLGLQFGAFLAGDTAAQRSHVVDALSAADNGEGFFDESDWLYCAAALAAREGRSESALRLAGGAGTLNRRNGSKYAAQLAAPMIASMERNIAALGRDRADLEADGERMSWPQLLAEALAEPPTTS